jgi:hypothetical protein
MSKHMDGPWNIGMSGGRHNANIIYDALGECVCEVYRIPQNIGINAAENDAAKRIDVAIGLANARLISAAPDLLAACEALTKVIEQAAHDHPDEFWLGSEYHDGIAATKKARETMNTIAYDVEPGRSIDRAAFELAVIANARGARVESNFNGIDLVVCPGDSSEVVLAQFGAAMKVRSVEHERVQRIKDAAQDLLSACEAAKTELENLWAFYGKSLHVVGWHLNGDHEPLDRFFEDSNVDAVEKLSAAIVKAKGTV